jgi:hypothetical protein
MAARVAEVAAPGRAAKARRPAKTGSLPSIPDFRPGCFSWPLGMIHPPHLIDPSKVRRTVPKSHSGQKKLSPQAGGKQILDRINQEHYIK